MYTIVKTPVEEPAAFCEIEICRYGEVYFFLLLHPFKDKIIPEDPILAERFPQKIIFLPAVGVWASSVVIIKTPV
jgi:hypothetical protein